MTRVSTTDGCCALDLPAEWEVSYDVQGLPLVSVAPGEPFRTNAVLTYARLEPGTDLDAWQRTNEGLLAQAMQDFLLLDLERLDVGGRPGARRLAHHIGAGDVSLTMEQWVTVVGSVGVTLTLTCATMRYPDLTETFDGIAHSLRIESEPTVTSPGVA